MAQLPLGVSRSLGAALGLMVYHAWRKRRSIALEGIAGTISRGAIAWPGGAGALSREHFRSLGRNLAELSKVYFGSGDALVDSVTVKGKEHFDAALSRGKGVIIVTAHFGNWELLGLSFSRKLAHIAGVARRQSNPYINDFIVRTREAYGSSVVYKEGALRKFISTLREGGTVGVLVDQAVMPHEGVLVDYLGAKCWTTKMPAALARRTGAAVVPVFMRSTSEGNEITVMPEVSMTGDDVVDTQAITRCVEQAVQHDPQLWLWIHRRWKRAPAQPI